MPSTPLTYTILNYGCQMNEHDAEIMEGLLVGRGWTAATSEADADLVVLNTCSVRGGAENRALGRLESLKRLKLERPDAVIAFCGCVAQEKTTEVLDRYPHLDLVVGTRDYIKLPDLVEHRRNGGERLVVVDDIDKPFSVNTVPVRKSPFKALVNIMYGCNNQCTFCIVPQTRGKEWSRPLEDVVAEISALAGQGYREVMLLGQNVNSYRDDKKRDFADLLHAVNAIEGIWRIRYTSPNPKDCRDRHIGAVAQCEKVCEHLHLPAQSGSNSVLIRMKRSYNRDRYLRQVRLFREQNRVSSVTTDLIVGFCGETDEEFDDTMRLVEEVRFDSAFMFKYSPRPGTRAALDLADDVAPQVKQDRLARLIERQEEITREVNAGHVGQSFEVLVEGPARRGEGQLMGRTRTDKVVVFSGPDSLVGSLCPVEVTDAQAHTLFGRLVTPADATSPVASSCAS